jgi:hypothetical protein
MTDFQENRDTPLTEDWYTDYAREMLGADTRFQDALEDRLLTQLNQSITQERIHTMIKSNGHHTTFSVQPPERPYIKPRTLRFSWGMAALLVVILFGGAIAMGALGMLPDFDRAPQSGAAQRATDEPTSMPSLPPATPTSVSDFSGTATAIPIDGLSPTVVPANDWPTYILTSTPVSSDYPSGWDQQFFPAVIARRPLTGGTIISAEDVAIALFPAEATTSAFPAIDNVIGKQLCHAVDRWGLVLSSNIAETSATLNTESVELESNEVAVTLPLEDANVCDFVLGETMNVEFMYNVVNLSEESEVVVQLPDEDSQTNSIVVSIPIVQIIDPLVVESIEGITVERSMTDFERVNLGIHLSYPARVLQVIPNPTGEGVLVTIAASPENAIPLVWAVDNQLPIELTPVEE